MALQLGHANASPLMSVEVTPASSERISARPFDVLRSAPPRVGSSWYCVTPPTQTSSGRPGGEAIGMSYEHWSRQKSQVL